MAEEMKSIGTKTIATIDDEFKVILCRYGINKMLKASKKHLARMISKLDYNNMTTNKNQSNLINMGENNAMKTLQEFKIKNSTSLMDIKV